MNTVVLDSNFLSNNAITLQYTVTLALTANEARRLVNRQIVPVLGTGLVAVKPELVIVNEQPFWRVPIKLSLPNWGDLGQVGTVSIDALSGQLLLTDENQEEIINHARWLYQGATLQAK